MTDFAPGVAATKAADCLPATRDERLDRLTSALASPIKTISKIRRWGLDSSEPRTNYPDFGKANRLLLLEELTVLQEAMCVVKRDLADDILSVNVDLAKRLENALRDHVSRKGLSATLALMQKVACSVDVHTILANGRMAESMIDATAQVEHAAVAPFAYNATALLAVLQQHKAKVNSPSRLSQTLKYQGFRSETSAVAWAKSPEAMQAKLKALVDALQLDIMRDASTVANAKDVLFRHGYTFMTDAMKEATAENPRTVALLADVDSVLANT